MTDYHHWCCDRDRIFRCLPIAPLQSSASACGSCGRRRRHSTELNLSGLVKGMRKCTVIYRKLSTSEAKVFNQDLSCFNPSSMILLGNLGEQTPLRDYLHKALSSFCMCTHPSNAFGLDWIPGFSVKGYQTGSTSVRHCQELHSRDWNCSPDWLCQSESNKINQHGIVVMNCVCHFRTKCLQSERSRSDQRRTQSHDFSRAEQITDVSRIVPVRQNTHSLQ